MKKRILSVVLTVAMVLASLVYQPAIKEVKAAAWNLVWSDEFDGNSLDTGVWTRETGGSDGGGWGNNELEYYTDRTDNSYVSDGTLKIVARRENYGGCRFTSARLKSAGKKSFKYGRMEARIKVNGGNQDGVWPAFWMMGDDGTPWPWCGELDIMEHANSRNYVEGTIHWNAGGSSYGTAYNHIFWGSYSVPAYYYYSDNTNNGINGWHTYGVVWTDSTIQWYVDNHVYLTAYLTPDNAYAFQKNHYFLLNLALGSNSTGYTGNVAPNDSFRSATMEVDYVRVFSGSGDLNDTNIGGTVTEPTTPSDGYTALANNTVTTIGDCSLYAGSWDNGAISYKGSKLSDLNVRLDSTSGNPGTWGTQLKYPMNLIQGKKYNVTLKFDSTKSGTMYWKNEGSSDTVDLGTAQYAVNAGTNTKTIQITADSKNTAVMEMSGMPAGTVLNNISISAIQEADETTAKPAYQPQPGNFDAFNTIEAENYTSNNGGVIDENSSAGNGHNIGGILDKTSLTYGTVNFTEPASSINFQYSCPQDCGGTADVYCDGTKVGTVTLNSNASSWNEYGNVTAKLDSVITTGVHSIKLLFNTKDGSAYACNLDYFSFNKASEDQFVPSGYTTATVNQWMTSGKWGCYFGNWNGTASGSYKWISDADYNIYVDQANKGTEWLVQGSYTGNVTSGHTYKVSVDVTSTKDCFVGMKEGISNDKETQVYTDLTANSTKTLTGTYKVTNNQIKVMFELGKSVESGTNINFKKIKIEDITSGIINPQTTVAPTTKEAPTASPTTVAPTVVGEDDSIPAPVGLTYAGNETLPYYFAWQSPADDIESYNVYVDGKFVATSNVTAINLTSEAFSSGNCDYIVSVRSVRNGKESKATSITYTFAGGSGEKPTTVVPTTVAPTTKAVPTTVAPTTKAVPTTVAPTTKIPTTVAPTTKAVPTTVAPTTKEAPTASPTTVAPTVVGEDDSIPAPVGLTYAGNETLPYYFAWQSPADDIESYNVYVDGKFVATSNVTAINLTSEAFSSGNCDYIVSVRSVRNGKESKATSITYTFAGGSGEKPTTVVPTTVAPTTKAVPTTVAPTTKAVPTTVAPTTKIPTTVAPTTKAVPTTVAPTTKAVPTTVAPTTKAVPTTVAPTTKAVPTTVAPTTKAVPTTVAPTTKAVPTTVVPTTKAVPTTVAPTTKEMPTEFATTTEASVDKGILNTDENGINEVNNKISKLNADKGDMAGSSFAKVMLKAKSGKKKVSLSWKKVTGATEYIIYGSACGKNNKVVKIKMVKGKKVSIKKLKKGKFYKYMIVAVNGNKVVAVSKVCHIATKGGKYGNVNKITLNKKKITLTKGKKFKIKAKAKSDKKVRNHIAKFRYESTNTNVAEVSSKGVVKAIGKGKTVIYVFGQNGISQKINVVVK
ncbi:family 16 glycosylhydrolase [Eubacterium sp.]|uniref:family 16 glycosylhydrolase n=1 Tax=Eubacterium sp. TaxID=142586 RepID=UPI0039A27DFC